MIIVWSSVFLIHIGGISFVWVLSSVKMFATIVLSMQDSGSTGYDRSEWEAYRKNLTGGEELLWSSCDPPITPCILRDSMLLTFINATAVFVIST